MLNTTKHQVTAQDAERIREWLNTRGGLALWRSANLANPGGSWTTPFRNAQGLAMGKPTWEAESAPYRVITDASEVEVVTEREVKRFRIAIRLGSQGMSYKLTDASTAKVRREVAKAGAEATYRFDYETQEAIILVPAEVVPL